MEYNKNQFQKTNSKKVLHKIKKHWVVVSMSLLMALGGGITATHASAQADTNAGNSNNQTTGKANMASRINSNLKAMQGNSANKQSNANQNNNQSNVNAKSINQQANVLHQRILQNSVQGRTANDNNQNQFSAKNLNVNNSVNVKDNASNGVKNASRIPGVKVNLGSVNKNANQVNDENDKNKLAARINANQVRVGGMDSSNTGQGSFIIRYEDATNNGNGTTIDNDRGINSDDTSDAAGQAAPSLDGAVENVPKGYSLTGIYYNGVYVPASRIHVDNSNKYSVNYMSDANGNKLNIPSDYQAGNPVVVHIEVQPNNNNQSGRYVIDYDDASNNNEIIQSKATSDTLASRFNPDGSFNAYSFANAIPSGYQFKDLKFTSDGGRTYTYNTLNDVSNGISTPSDYTLPNKYVSGSHTIEVDVTPKTNNTGLVSGNINYVDASDGDALIDQEPVTGANHSSLNVNDFDDLAPVGYTTTSSDQTQTQNGWNNQLTSGLTDNVYVTKSSVTPSPHMPMSGYSHINIEYMNGNSKVDSDDTLGKIHDLLSNGSSYVNNLPNGYALNESTNGYVMPTHDRNVLKIYKFEIGRGSFDNSNRSEYNRLNQEAAREAAGNGKTALINQLNNARYTKHSYSITIPVKVNGNGPSANATSTDLVKYVDMSSNGQPTVGQRTITGKTGNPVNFGPLTNFVPSGYEFNSLGSHDNYYQDNRTDIIYVQKAKSVTPTATKGVINVKYVASDGTPLGEDGLLQSDGQPFNINSYKSNLPSGTEFDSIVGTVPTSFIANQSQTATIKVDRLGTINVYYMDGNGVISNKSITGKNGSTFAMNPSNGSFSAQSTAGTVNGNVPENYNFSNIAIGSNINTFNTGSQSVVVNVSPVSNPNTSNVTSYIEFHDVSDTSNPNSIIGTRISDSAPAGTPIQYINYLSQIPNGYKYDGMGAEDDNVVENGEVNVINVTKDSNASHNNNHNNVTPTATKGVINIMYKNSDGQILSNQSVLGSGHFNINDYTSSLPANTEFDKVETAPSSFAPGQTENAVIDVDNIGTINIYYLKGNSVVGKYSTTSTAGNSFNKDQVINSELPTNYTDPNILVGNNINTYKAGTQDIIVSVNGNGPAANQRVSNDKVVYLNLSNHNHVVDTEPLNGNVGSIIDYGPYLMTKAKLANANKPGVPYGYKFVRMGNYDGTIKDNDTNYILVENSTDNSHDSHSGNNPSGKNGNNTHHDVPNNVDGAINVEYVTSDGTLIKDSPSLKVNGRRFDITSYESGSNLPNGTSFVKVLSGNNVNTYEKNTLQNVVLEVKKATTNSTVNVRYIDIDGGNAILKQVPITGQTGTLINYSNLTNASNIPSGYNFVGYGTLVPDYINGQNEDILVKPANEPTPSDNTGVINVVYEDGNGNEISSYATTGKNGTGFSISPEYTNKIPSGYKYDKDATLGYTTINKYIGNDVQDAIIRVYKTSTPASNVSATIKIIDNSDSTKNKTYTDTGTANSLINYNNYESNIPSGYHVTSIIGNSHLEKGDINKIYIAKSTTPTTPTKQYGHILVKYLDSTHGDSEVNQETVDGQIGSLFNLSPYENNIPQDVSGQSYVFNDVKNNGNVDTFNANQQEIDIEVSPAQPSDAYSNIIIHYRKSGTGAYSKGQTVPDVNTEKVSGLKSSVFNAGTYEHTIPSGYKFAGAPGVQNINSFPSNGNGLIDATIYVLPD